MFSPSRTGAVSATWILRLRQLRREYSSFLTQFILFSNHFLESISFFTHLQREITGIEHPTIAQTRSYLKKDTQYLILFFLFYAPRGTPCHWRRIIFHLSFEHIIIFRGQFWYVMYLICKA